MEEEKDQIANGFLDQVAFPPNTAEIEHILGLTTYIW